MQTLQVASSLLQNRNHTVARSFYRELKSEGFSHQQIIELSTTLLDLAGCPPSLVGPTPRGLENRARDPPRFH